MNTDLPGGESMAGHSGNGSRWTGSPWRIAAWAVAAFLLLLPLIAGADWTASDFVFAAVLLFGSLGAYELATRLNGNTAYRAGIGLALAATLLLVWANGAVGITDSAADGWFFLAPAAGFVGAFLARFRAQGMVVAMFATAGAVALIAVVALFTGIVPAFNSPLEVLGISGFFVALFVGSALLFREAARGETEGGAA